MLELPEVTTLAKQMNHSLFGKKVKRVLPPTKAHKFCWFAGEPAEYDAKLRGSLVQSATHFGIYAELVFDNGMHVCVNDGVHVRLVSISEIPKQYQLVLEFEDETALVFTVAMYGGIVLHNGTYDNPYYLKSRQAISPFSKEFAACYESLLAQSKPTLSAKAFLATEQRFPGIGNGVLQDILFAAGIHPKQKLAVLQAADKKKLQSCVISVLEEMIAAGGRDTEKDLFGRPGGYRVKLSKNTASSGCTNCGTTIVKETYLGGAIYFCPVCQPLRNG